MGLVMAVVQGCVTEPGLLVLLPGQAAVKSDEELCTGWRSGGVTS